MCCRAAPALLAHVNLLLTVYGGAALATAARLKWDPSTYVVVRELFPREYRAAAATLAAGGATLLLLPHLAAAALNAEARARRLMLYAYAAAMALLVAGELVFGAWLAAQVAAWLRSPAAQQMAEALALGDHVRPLLRYLARWHPLPDRIDELLQEAQEDAPRNAYVALALGALLALLQPLAALLALLAARAPATRARSASLVPLHPRPPSYDSAGYDYQKMPRTTYRNGRIVVLSPSRA
ncbi:uncharacterized protein LOC124634066 isoform X2 [Helicoverpa zea]|uniref:uncharacterized protein LOC124634066 isoform X2 n=1 Tax=Helicoverpa zea TaxID=7113 RepID=UPI001F571DAE|nr:uncharacterized protein LOC124634066 isoform X2 [Helicoverpa zea]